MCLLLSTAVRIGMGNEGKTVCSHLESPSQKVQGSGNILLKQEGTVSWVSPADLSNTIQRHLFCSGVEGKRMEEEGNHSYCTQDSGWGLTLLAPFVISPAFQQGISEEAGGPSKNMAQVIPDSQAWSPKPQPATPSFWPHCFSFTRHCLPQVTTNEAKP